MRVLVIDDEPYVRAALMRVLGSPLLEVVAAADAEEGIAALEAAPTRLAIVDVVLPGMDGVAAIRKIRAEFPLVRIIAMSGGGNFGLDEYRPDAISTCAYLAACRAAGAHGVIAKPFETHELRALIHSVLEPETVSA
jgi:CheY-like chemotaxis protein